MVANLAWGGAELRDFVRDRDALGLSPSTTKVGRADRALHARARGRDATRPRAAGRAPGLELDPRRAVLIIQDMQNDVVSEGGAFAASGAPAHAKAQNVVENIRRVAAAARAHGVPVIHVWFVVEPGAPGVTLNAPLFTGLVEQQGDGARDLGRGAGRRARA